MAEILEGKRVLITGGTSGLGKSVAQRLIEKKAFVHAFGNKGPAPDFTPARFTLHRCNHAELAQVVQMVETMKEQGLTFDLLINNAGILTPPQYTQTVDGFELSYQVNFLAHVLLTRLLLSYDLLRPFCIVNVSSPIYVMGRLNPQKIFDPSRYGVLQTYADTKLFMALFSEWLAGRGFESFSFNPGVFNSGIYRQQKKWFHRLYHLGAPLMTPAARVAEGMVRSIESRQWISGHFMTKKAKPASLKRYDESRKQEFWQAVERQLEPFLSASRAARSEGV